MTARSLAVPGLLLGIGLGGFVDGILLHQILQWHHLVSEHESATTVAGLETNTLWDGLFHAVTWVAVAAGVWALWVRRAALDEVQGGRTLLGWMLVGWGSFNVVEGLVDHHVLELHHVRGGTNELVWDLAFLAFGVVLVAVGLALASRRATNRRARKAPRRRRVGSRSPRPPPA